MAGAIVSGAAVVRPMLAQEPAAKGSAFTTAPSEPPGNEVIREAVAGIKNGEHALYLYERIERVEYRKETGDGAPQSVKVSRVVPAGTGIAKIPLGEDGKPSDADAYRDELTKLLN